MIKLMPIHEIRLPKRHRKELGDIAGLAKSISEIGLLHPPSINTDNEVLSGIRRIEAAVRLGWTEILVSVIEVDTPLRALQIEEEENKKRKDFTESESVSLMEEKTRLIGNRRGQRTDKGQLQQNFAEVQPGTQTREIAAKAAGFANHETARQAKKVVEEAVETIITMMDKGEVSINAAAKVAGLPKEEQAAIAAKGPKAVKKKAAEIRGKSKVNGQIVDDPDHIHEKRKKGKIPPDVIPEVSEPEPGEDKVDEETTEPVEPEQTDEEWLESLPARKKLSEVCRKKFDDAALCYRNFKDLRDNFAREGAKRVNKIFGRSNRNAYYDRVRSFIKIEEPRHWFVCAAPEYGGCGGTGESGMGSCLKCGGYGFRMKN